MGACRHFSCCYLPPRMVCLLQSLAITLGYLRCAAPQARLQSCFRCQIMMLAVAHDCTQGAVICLYQRHLPYSSRCGVLGTLLLLIEASSCDWNCCATLRQSENAPQDTGPVPVRFCDGMS